MPIKITVLSSRSTQNCGLHHHHQHHNICPHHDVTTATTTITIHSLHQHHSHCDDNVAEGVVVMKMLKMTMMMA